MYTNGGIEMAGRHIICDKTEVILNYLDDKKYKVINLTYDQITRISFEACKEFSLFHWVPSEKITIVTKKVENSIVYTKLKHKNLFEEYKKELARFAKDNRITFYNSLEG
jgi:hypothetical protein